MTAPAPVEAAFETPRNCWTCRWARSVVERARREGWTPFGLGYTCDALTLDEEIDWPIICYVDGHCDPKTGMPFDGDSAACPGWSAR